MNEPNDPFDELHLKEDQASRLTGLGEMERRLRQFQPRAPQIDFLAIEQEANCVDTPMPAASTLIPGVGIVSSSRFAGTIASAWLCGAVVGAACVFFFMSNQKQPMLDVDSSASSDLNLDSDHQLAEIPSPAQSSVVLDSFEGQTSTVAGERDLHTGTEGVDSTIRWRGRYIKTNELLSHPVSMRELGNSVAVTTDSTTDSDSFSNSLLSQFSPPQPVTQAELRRELLNPSKDTVH